MPSIPPWADTAPFRWRRESAGTATSSVRRYITWTSGSGTMARNCGSAPAESRGSTPGAYWPFTPAGNAAVRYARGVCPGFGRRGLQSLVRPVAYDGMAAPLAASLGNDSVCQPVYIDYGIEPLAIYLQSDAVEALGKAASAAGSALVRYVPRPEEAEFVVLFDRAAERFVFTQRPSSRVLVAGGAGLDARAAFSETLGRIARARALLQVAGEHPPRPAPPAGPTFD